MYDPIGINHNPDEIESLAVRIVHVLTRLLRAGSEENTIASCLSQARAGHEVCLVHGREYDSRYYDGRLNEIRLIHLQSLRHPLELWGDVVAFADLVALFRRLKPDVVHTHQSKAGILGRLAAASSGVPTVIHGVHIDPFVGVSAAQKSIYLLAERTAAAFTHAFVDVSRGMRDAYHSRGIGRPGQHFVVHSGFDVARFKRAVPPDDWRDILRVGAEHPKPPTVVMLAAMEPRKRHLEFLDCLPHLITLVPNVRVIFAGEGHLRSAIEEKVARLNLDDHVCCTGFREDPERIIALADVCILTSVREGLPRVLIQYLAAGQAVVVSDLPGLDEIIINGRNALVVPPEDLQALVRKVSELLRDPVSRSVLAKNARNTDLGTWDINIMCQTLAMIYSNARSTVMPAQHVSG